MLNLLVENTTVNSRSLQEKFDRIVLTRFSHKTKLMDGMEFERLLVKKLAEIIEANGLKHDPCAKAAWPYKKAAGRTWQAIRTDDTPQRLTIRDAYALVQQVGFSMSQLCALVEGENLIKNAGVKKDASDVSPQFSLRKEAQNDAEPAMSASLEAVSGDTGEV